MGKIDWNKHRHNGIGYPERKGEIDLVSVYRHIHPSDYNHKPIDFLLSVMNAQPIISRQAASIAIAMAKQISER